MHIYTRVGWFRPPPMGTGLKYGPERFCWWSYRISPVGYFSTVGDHLFSVLVPFYNLSFFAQFSIGFTVLKATRGLRYRPYIRSWPFFPCPPTRPKAIRPNPIRPNPSRPKFHRTEYSVHRKTFFSFFRYTGIRLNGIRYSGMDGNFVAMGGNKVKWKGKVILGDRKFLRNLSLWRV